MSPADPQRVARGLCSADNGSCNGTAIDHVRYADRPMSSYLYCKEHRDFWLLDSKVRRILDFHMVTHACHLPGGQGIRRWVYSTIQMGDGRCEVEWGDGLEQLLKSETLESV